MAIDLSDEIVCDFLVEAGEILDELGEQLVELEHRPDDRELLNAVFRGFHTIKGGAGFINADPMVAICHRAEDTFNLLRHGERQVDAPLMDVLLRVLDALNDMFERMRAGEEPEPAAEELMDSLGRLARNESPGAARKPLDTSRPDVAAPDESGGKVGDKQFEKLLDTLRAGQAKPPAPAASAGGDDIDEDEFERLLDALHGENSAPGVKPVSAAGREATVPDARAAQPGELNRGSEAQDSRTVGADAADGVQIGDDFEALLDQLHGNGAPGRPSSGSATLPAAHQDGTPEGVGAVSAGSETVRKKRADAGPPSTGEARAASEATEQHAPAPETTVRVDTAVLDRIMNMVGELVLVRNRISTLDAALADEELAKAVSNLDVVTADLQAGVMRTRMQPIRKVFGRFPRVVRDLARSLGKEVDLVLRGEDTDLDKNLVEALADPMVHLVRNAVDHGLEAPEVRAANGKARRGSVTLSAEQEGDHILLTVADDGAGMDAEALRRLAVRRGLVDQDAAARLDEHDCLHLIFAPGFSTKAEVSDVSGRGVGMDVVKSRITQLNGSVDIASEPGLGTRVFIRVPLTLAIVQTLMVKLGTQTYALPLGTVREIFNLDMQHTHVVDGQLTAVVRGKPLPLYFLGRWLSASAADDAKGRHVVVVRVGTQNIGFVVDQLLGREEVVVKPLGAMLQGIQGVAGATITGDGRIALILDAPGLVSAYARRR